MTDARQISEKAVEALGPALRPADGALKGRYVCLVPVQAATQLAALYRAGHHPEDPRGPELWRWMGVHPFADEQAMLAWLEVCTRSADPLFRTICDRASGTPLGMVAFMAIRPNDRVLELGSIWMGHGLAGRTGATEAIALMLGHAFDLGYRRVEWKCNAANLPSRQAALRFGFRYEGTFWRHMIVKGHNRDTAWFSMLAEEWPARRAALAAWLDPLNFDATGRQRQSLAR